MQKIKLFVIFIAILICFVGCKSINDKTGKNMDEKADSGLISGEEGETETSLVVDKADTNHMTDETEYNTLPDETECSPMKDEDAKDFWKDGNTYFVKLKYAMDGEEFLLKSEGNAKICKERDYNNGAIYNVIINSDDGNIKNRSMAYFYVEDEKIYVISNYGNNSEHIDTNNLQLVFQRENIEEDDGKGLYYSITNIGGIMKLRLYTYLVETNYYNRMEWGKQRNINLYETGYGAGKDLFRVEFIRNKEVLGYK